jgi:hypothetical protein
METIETMGKSLLATRETRSLDLAAASGGR